MKSRITNILLGIIATCLVLLTIQLATWPTQTNANEQSNANEKDLSQNSTGYGLVPLEEDGSIKVTLASDDPLNVNISTIRGRRPAMGQTKTGVYVLGTCGPWTPLVSGGVK